MISVRPMTEADIPAIAAAARPADLAEIEEGCGQSMASALAVGLRSSVAAHIISWEGLPLAAFGDVSHSPCAGIGVPWLVSTMHIEKHARPFLRACRPLLNLMLARHPTLVNYVDARNTAAIRWLEWLGFEIGSAVAYGPKGLLFRQFHMTRQQAAPERK